MKKNILLILIVAGITLQAGAQTIKLTSVAYRTSNAVYLRWKLENAEQWRIANAKGYHVERAIKGTNAFVKLHSKPIQLPGKELLLKMDTAGTAFKTAILALRVPKTEQEKIADQSIYGFYFVLSSYNIQDAILSASGFVDSTVESGKMYDYRVSVAGLGLVSSAVCSATTVDRMPAGTNLEAEFLDKNVALYSNMKPFMEECFAAVIERSTDSIHFETITRPPFLTQVSNQENGPADTNANKLFYFDGGLKNGIKYYYRVVGINIFGLHSQPGKVISGICTPELSAKPVIHQVDSLRGNYVIDWTMADSLRPYIAKYNVLYSGNGDDSSYRVIKTVTQPTDLKAILNMPLDNSNYFKIEAIGVRKNQVATSIPYFFELKDSIPPAVPTGLTAVVSPKGVVTLSWNRNSEKDFLGYRVLRTFTKEAEFTSMVSTPLNAQVFSDTLSMTQLNSFVYYKLSALDNRYNESNSCDSILVIRPDNIAPSPAKLLSVERDGGKAVVSFIGSASKDVKNYTLFRKQVNDTAQNAWETLALLKNTDSSYTDAAIKKGVVYRYRLEAVDYGGLKSVSSDSLSLTAESGPAEKGKPISNLNSFVSRDYKYIELNWRSSGKELVKQISVYRANERTPDDVSLIATLPATANRYVDKEVQANNAYRYYIKTTFTNKAPMDMQLITVNY